MIPVHPAQDLIKALRAQSDPPDVDGPPKIELARAAWDSAEHYFPNKGEVIAEWLLTRLLKDKGKEGAANPILDLHYWMLLSDILCSSDGGSVKYAHPSRTMKAWLPVLLNRIPLAPIITAYFILSTSLDSGTRVDLNKVLYRCLAIMWPLAAPRLSPDTLLDCFGAVLPHLVATHVDAVNHEKDPPAAQVAIFISASYRAACGNSTNKRKLHTSFLKSHFVHWLQCIDFGLKQGDAEIAPFADIYSAGIETLFNIEILRHAEDHRYDPALKTALLEALPVSRAAVLNALPRLLSSFIQSLRRTRNALFSQGFSSAAGHVAAQLQATGVGFYVLCEEILDLSQNPRDSLAWAASVKLLHIVDDDNLFNSLDEDIMEVLRHSGQLAVEALNHRQRDVSIIRNAVDVLVVLTRIDHEIMSPKLPLILPAVIRTPHHHPECVLYLRMLLDIHMKTRSIITFIDLWLNAVSIGHLQEGGRTTREAYSYAFGSPIFSFEFLDRFGQAVHSFLTPGQVSDVVRTVTQRLHDTFQPFQEEGYTVAEDGQGIRKKRKGVRPPWSGRESRIDPEWCAVEFALVSRISGVIFSSLALDLLLEDAKAEILDAITAACLLGMPYATEHALKALNFEEGRMAWAWQIVASCSLHMYHDYRKQGWPRVPIEEAVASQLRAALGGDDTLPEFSLAAIRVLLDHALEEATHVQAIFEDVLRCLDSLCMKPGDLHLSWSGRSHELLGHSHTTAILHLIFSRWLPLADSRASPEQLTRFTKILLGIFSREFFRAVSPVQSGWQLTPATILHSSLHTADTWELRRFRDAFLTEMLDITSSLTDVDTQEVLKQSGPMHRLPALSTVIVFETLLHAPDEYLPRIMQAEFVRRALAADVSIGTADLENAEEEFSVRALLVTREFLRRATIHVGNTDQLSTDGFFQYLLTSDTLPVYTKAAAYNDRFNAVTLDLISVYLISILRTARQAQEEDALAALEDIKRCLDISVGQRLTSRNTIAEGTLHRLVAVVTTNHEPTQFSDRMLGLLREVFQRMATIYSPQLLRVARNASSMSGVWESADLLGLWSQTLALGRWLRTDRSTLPRLGSQLLRQMLSDRQRTPTTSACLSIMDILREELNTALPDDREGHMNYFLTGYIACCRSRGSIDALVLDASLSNASKSMTASDHSSLLDHILEALADSRSFDTRDFASLIHLLRVVALGAPEGTSKAVQQVLSRALTLLADHTNDLSLPAIRRQVLSLLNACCSDRAALMRMSDLSNVWSILGHLLANSPVQDENTDNSAFQEIVAVVSGLVRLRRDLVVNTLPQLGFVLRRLVSALRALRPQLGAKQTRLVMKSLPQWINTSQSLSTEEAKVLARLMTTLSTKTIVRTYGQSTETQKPESLVRPFSKHAAYVLTAYVEAVNDPLCHISTQIQKELRPGLFALCDMLGEHNRDAMMVSALDADGKTMMKALWREYEKQRYVGKG